MMSLELQQRALLHLLKGRGAPPDDAYLQHIAASRELAMLREIAVWWRIFQIERQCRFTARLLKRLGRLDQTVTAYFDRCATSPFIEELSRDFLRTLHDHPDPLVAAMSAFEYAFLEVRGGSTDSFDVIWDRSPDPVFAALEAGDDLPAPDPDSRYRMQIDRALPRMIESTREPRPGA
jgi:hypothetical protein